MKDSPWMKVLALAWLAGILSGCASTLNVPMADIKTIPAPIVKQVPLKAGVVLPPENEVFVDQHESNSTTNIQSGKLVRKYATEILPPLFAEVAFVNGKPYPPDAGLIVVPVIEENSYEQVLVAGGFAIRFEATVGLAVTVTDPDGTRLWSRVGKATMSSRTAVGIGFNVEQLIGEATTSATQEAFREMAREISIAPEIDAYARKHAKPAAAIAPEKASPPDLEGARAKLKSAFEKGLISPEQMGKALEEIKAPSRSRLLDSFLNGKITDVQFGELY